MLQEERQGFEEVDQDFLLPVDFPFLYSLFVSASEDVQDLRTFEAESFLDVGFFQVNRELRKVDGSFLLRDDEGLDKAAILPLVLKKLTR